MRFFSDEGFSFKIVAELRALGHDVVTVSDIGEANQGLADHEILQYAVQTERALLTVNRKDFFLLHRESPRHFGIVARTEDPNPSRCARKIHENVLRERDIVGKVIRIYKGD